MAYFVSTKVSVSMSSCSRLFSSSPASMDLILEVCCRKRSRLGLWNEASTLPIFFRVFIAGRAPGLAGGAARPPLRGEDPLGLPRQQRPARDPRARFAHRRGRGAPAGRERRTCGTRPEGPRAARGGARTIRPLVHLHVMLFSSIICKTPFKYNYVPHYFFSVLTPRPPSRAGHPGCLREVAPALSCEPPSGTAPRGWDSGENTLQPL